MSTISNNYFGRYQLLEKIASGGMGEVYKAKDPSVTPARLVALKRIYPHLSHHPKYLALFMREAYITLQLQHKNIVQVYELGERHDELFIAMELIIGKHVGHYLATGDRLSAEEIALVGKDILEALVYAHTHKEATVIHQDISPENIILDDQGVAKLCDFGLARALRTATNVPERYVIGKLAYMAPEQFYNPDDATVDCGVDIYGLGVVLYELLTGKRRFIAVTVEQLLIQVKECAAVVDPSDLQHCPASFVSILERATARAVTDRYSSAGEFLLALDGFLYHENIASIRESLASHMLGTTEKAKQSEFETTDSLHAPTEWLDLKPQTLVSADSTHPGDSRFKRLLRGLRAAMF